MKVQPIGFVLVLMATRILVFMVLCWIWFMRDASVLLVAFAVSAVCYFMYRDIVLALTCSGYGWFVYAVHI
jgi:hypothetical protein